MNAHQFASAAGCLLAPLALAGEPASLDQVRNGLQALQKSVSSLELNLVEYPYGSTDSQRRAEHIALVNADGRHRCDLVSYVNGKPFRRFLVGFGGKLAFFAETAKPNPLPYPTDLSQIASAYVKGGGVIFSITHALFWRWRNRSLLEWSEKNARVAGSGTLTEPNVLRCSSGPSKSTTFPRAKSNCWSIPNSTICRGECGFLIARPKR